MKKTFKRALSIALVVIMVLLMMPTGISAFSAVAEDEVEYDKTIYVGSNQKEDGDTHFTSLVRAIASVNGKTVSMPDGTTRPGNYLINVQTDVVEKDETANSYGANWLGTVRANFTIVGDSHYVRTIKPLTTSASAWMITGSCNGATGTPGAVVTFKNLIIDVREAVQFTATDTTVAPSASNPKIIKGASDAFSPRQGSSIILDRVEVFANGKCFNGQNSSVTVKNSKITTEGKYSGIFHYDSNNSVNNIEVYNSVITCKASDTGLLHVGATGNSNNITVTAKIVNSTLEAASGGQLIINQAAKSACERIINLDVDNSKLIASGGTGGNVIFRSRCNGGEMNAVVSNTLLQTKSMPVYNGNAADSNNSIELNNCTVTMTGNPQAFTETGAGADLDLRLINTDVATANAITFNHGGDGEMKITAAGCKLSAAENKDSISVFNNAAGTMTVNLFSATEVTAPHTPIINAGAKMNLNVWNASIKATTNAAGIGVYNKNANTEMNASFYGENTVVSTVGGKAIYAVEKSDGTFNIYGGTFTTTGGQLLDFRGKDVFTNIHGGTFKAAGTTEQVMIEVRSNMNIYDGTFMFTNTSAVSQLLRHDYHPTNSEAGSDKTAVNIYGGTFIHSGKGAVIGAGTSNTNGYHGNFNIYDGTFIKTQAVASGGYGIIGHKNTDTTASNRMNSNYFIFGGKWYCQGNDMAVYQYSNSSDAAYTANTSGKITTYAKGKLNQALTNEGLALYSTAVLGLEEKEITYDFNGNGIIDINDTVTFANAHQITSALSEYKNTDAKKDTDVFGGNKYIQMLKSYDPNNKTVTVRLVFEVKISEIENLEDIGFWVSGCVENPIERDASANETGIVQSAPITKLYRAVMANGNRVNAQEGYAFALLTVTVENPDIEDLYVNIFANTKDGNVIYGESGAWQIR